MQQHADEGNLQQATCVLARRLHRGRRNGSIAALLRRETCPPPLPTQNAITIEPHRPNCHQQLTD
jgi:hypothetical protein